MPGVRGAHAPALQARAVHAPVAGGILDYAMAVVGMHRVRRQHPERCMTHILAKDAPPAGITDADYTDQLVARTLPRHMASVRDRLARRMPQ